MLNLSFIGTVRHEKILKNLINAVDNTTGIKLTVMVLDLHYRRYKHMHHQISNLKKLNSRVDIIQTVQNI